MLLDDRAAGRRRPEGVHDRAVPDGDEWVINGEKWFSSYAGSPSFLIVMAVTDPEAPPYKRQSMFIVPAGTPGINVLRNVGIGYEPIGGGPRGYVRYKNVRVPRTTCSASAAGRSWSPRPGSAAAASITRCARSAWCGASST